jgi:hypothetical protein
VSLADHPGECRRNGASESDAFRHRFPKSPLSLSPAPLRRLRAQGLTFNLPYEPRRKTDRKVFTLEEFS